MHGEARAIPIVIGNAIHRTPSKRATFGGEDFGRAQLPDLSALLSLSL